MPIYHRSATTYYEKNYGDAFKLIFRRLLPNGLDNGIRQSRSESVSASVRSAA